MRFEPADPQGVEDARDIASEVRTIWQVRASYNLSYLAGSPFTGGMTYGRAYSPAGLRASS